jgi:hypothetical protein
MKKIPKIWLLASIGLFTTSASCEKTVTPAIEQINSCTECGGTFSGVFKQEKVRITFDKRVNEWQISNDLFSAPVPCKFPKELLIEGKEFTFDGKFSEVPYRSLVTRTICIEKIY